MLNLEKIKQLTAVKGMTMTELAKQLGMSIQALSRIIRENSTKVSTLERIAEILGVPVTTFFDEVSHVNTVSINTGVQGSPNAVQSVGSDNSSEVALLKSRIELLEELNRSYKEQIELLRNQILSLNNSPQ
nr:MAG TPA: helix-turn-helix domain protein [Caudoviricetes sp.]